MNTVPQNAKGPAEAATSPDRGSAPHPTKEKAMNTATDTTAAPVAASKAFDFATELDTAWDAACDLQRMLHLLMNDLEQMLAIKRGRKTKFGIDLTFQERNIDVTLWLVGKAWCASDELATKLDTLLAEREKLS